MKCAKFESALSLGFRLNYTSSNTVGANNIGAPKILNGFWCHQVLHAINISIAILDIILLLPVKVIVTDKFPFAFSYYLKGCKIAITIKK